MLTKEEQQVIDGAIAAVRSSSPRGAEVLAKKLKEAPLLNQKEIASWLREGDGFAYFWQTSWVQVARGWLLVKFLTEYWGTGTGVVWNSTQERAQVVNKLRVMSEGTLRQEITDVVSGRMLMRRLAQAQNSVSRLCWAPSHFTDPKNRPAQFTYLIHAMRPVATLAKKTVMSSKQWDFLSSRLGPYLREDTSTHDVHLKSAKLYLEKPEALLTEVLSCSVISDARPKTYRDFAFGFILHVPKENVCGAATKDMGSSSIQNMARGDKLVDLDALAQFCEVDLFMRGILDSYEYNLPSPTQLLQSTSTEHNEVFVVGSIGGLKVKPLGIFVKVTGTGMVWQSVYDDDKTYGIASDIRHCSRKLGIPIVAITDNTGTGSKLGFEAWFG